MKDDKSNSERTINVSARNVFEVMRYLAQAARPLGVLEISREMDLPASNVHRALASLEETQFAGRGDDLSKYIPGSMPHNLVRAMLNRFPIRKAASETLRQVAEHTGETTSLVVRLGWYGVIASVVEGPKEVYYTRAVGDYSLLHQRPSGLAILAGLGDDAVVDYRQFVIDLAPELSKVVLSPQFDRNLNTIRQQGYGYSYKNEDVRQSAVALPLRDADGVARAAISIAGPSPSKKGDLVDSQLFDLVGELEQQLQAEPELLASPYRHIADNEIRLAMTEDPEQV